MEIVSSNFRGNFTRQGRKKQFEQVKFKIIDKNKIGEIYLM